MSRVDSFAIEHNPEDGVVHGAFTAEQVDKVLTYIKGSSVFSSEIDVQNLFFDDHNVVTHHNIYAMIDETACLVGHIAENSGYFAFDYEDYKELTQILLKEALKVFE